MRERRLAHDLKNTLPGNITVVPILYRNEAGTLKPFTQFELPAPVNKNVNVKRSLKNIQILYK
jgi:hypothetical protein